MSFIRIAVLIDMVAIGLIVPVLPHLVGLFTDGNDEQARWFTIITFTFGAANFVASPLLGALSDRYGRRPVLLLGFTGLAFSFIVTGLATALWMLVAVRLVSGALQANAAIANAYVADISTPEQRAQRLGQVGAMFGIGFILGPVAGGLLGAIDVRLPFFAAGTLAILNGLYGFFVLPESLPPEKRATSFDWGRANPVGSLRLLRSRMGLLPLAGVGFLFQFAHTVLPTVFVLYTTYRYHWDSRTLGLTFLLTGVLGVIVSMFLVGPTVARIGERRTLLLGLAATAFGFAWYGWADTGWLYLLGAPVFALSGFIMPGLQGLMTRRVQPHEQGQLQGANQSLMGIGSILGPALFGEAFARALRGGHPPGLPIYLASGLLVAALSLAFAAARAPASAPQPAE
ncbi:MAG: TCR/Tet family MFS transporter [Phenylobacterium sp.]|nr:TCR/Tet family MFS transporter [Phenylobacterium sp.]